MKRALVIVNSRRRLDARIGAVPAPRVRRRDAANPAGADASATTRGDIMIHGLPNGLGFLGRTQRFRDWTAGCMAMTDREVDEL